MANVDARKGTGSSAGVACAFFPLNDLFLCVLVLGLHICVKVLDPLVLELYMTTVIYHVGVGN